MTVLRWAPIVAALLMVGCSDSGSSTYRIRDEQFYGEAIREISKCLTSGRDCVSDMSLPPELDNRKERCFATITGLTLEIHDTVAKVELDCWIGSAPVRITAVGDRGTKSNTISEPVAVVTSRPAIR